MNWYEKLDKFMKAKAKELKKIGLSPSLYWNEKDSEAIRKDFKEEDIERFFKRLKGLFDFKTMKRTVDTGGSIGIGTTAPKTIDLVEDSNPYCLIYTCKECPYGKRHKRGTLEKYLAFQHLYLTDVFTKDAIEELLDQDCWSVNIKEVWNER